MHGILQTPHSAYGVCCVLWRLLRASFSILHTVRQWQCINHLQILVYNIFPTIKLPHYFESVILPRQCTIMQMAQFPIIKPCTYCCHCWNCCLEMWWQT